MGVIAVLAEKAAKHFVKVGLADSYRDTLLGGGLGGLAGAAYGLISPGESETVDSKGNKVTKTNSRLMSGLKKGLIGTGLGAAGGSLLNAVTLPYKYRMLTHDAPLYTLIGGGLGGLAGTAYGLIDPGESETVDSKGNKVTKTNSRLMSGLKKGLIGTGLGAAGGSLFNAVTSPIENQTELTRLANTRELTTEWVRVADNRDEAHRERDGMRFIDTLLGGGLGGLAGTAYGLINPGESKTVDSKGNKVTKTNSRLMSGLKKGLIGTGLGAAGGSLYNLLRFQSDPKPDFNAIRSENNKSVSNLFDANQYRENERIKKNLQEEEEWPKIDYYISKGYPWRVKAEIDKTDEAIKTVKRLKKERERSIDQEDIRQSYKYFSQESRPLEAVQAMEKKYYDRIVNDYEYKVNRKRYLTKALDEMHRSEK